MNTMRAKLEVWNVASNKDDKGETSYERLSFRSVCGKDPFGPNGESEDNSFARWTPSANLVMTVTNASLFGKFKNGQKFYVDFTESQE